MRSRSAARRQAIILGEVTSRHPLVDSAHVDAGGRLVVGESQTIGDAHVEGTAWTIVTR